nr:hypothetical protein [Tanacetum cinerariifolium]
MIPEPGDANRDITVTETFHLKTDDELSNKELKQIEADDQAIQTIFLGLPEDIYAVVDSCETAQEIWLRERFTYNEGESIESYYHRFLKLMNDLKRNKHFPEKIATDYTQLYDFLKYNQKEVDELKAERIAKTQDPPHQDQPSFNQNYLQQPMPNPEDITDPTTAMNMALTLMAKAFKLNYSTPTNNNQRISSNPKNRRIAQPGQNAGNSAGYNDVIKNQVIQNAVQNPRIQNIGNQNGLIGVQGNGNLVAARAEGNAAGQNGNQIRCYNCRGKEEVEIQHQAKEYDLIAAAADLDEIKEVNANCVLMANLQQASTSGTQTDSAPVYDSDGSAEEAAKFVRDFKSLAKEADDSLAKHQALELEIERLFKAVVSQDIMIIVQNKSVVDTSDLQTELELIASLQNELQSNIYKNAKLRTQLFKKVSDQKDNTKNSSKNTKFTKQPIVKNLPKVGKTNTLSNPVTSNSVSTLQEPKSVNNDKVIAPGMFRINPSKTFKEEKQVPNTVSASARTKPITVSQPTVITKKDVNSDVNGLSSTGVDNTKTRRPQPRSLSKNERVPSVSKSSRSQNKESEVEEHHRNLLLSKNNKHISSACNNIKIDSQDVISKVICAMCKKCLISVNHDKCLSKNMNGKNYCGKNQNAKVSVKEIQMTYQPKASKPKKVGTRESLATPKPRKSRLLLRWSPTGKLFNQEGKLVDSSKSKSKSNGDNACTSNVLEPKIKRFPNST